jgi:arylsulfatase A-like enzyme
MPKGYLDTLPAAARKTITRKREQVNLKDSLARQAIQAYYASITFADAQVGRILETLDRTGLAKNTVVVFTSDHGYHMGEHGHYQKTTLFENAARVPLIIATPKMATAGKSTVMPVEMVDFYPTLAELCGLPLPKHLSGVSLAPTLQNIRVTPRRDALTQLNIRATPRRDGFTQFATGYSLYTGRYRYTEWGAKGSGGAELYDHTTDPTEMKNLANKATQKNTVTELSKRLHARIAEANRKPKGVQQVRK